jgi:hypothetical protein
MQNEEKFCDRLRKLHLRSISISRVGIYGYPFLLQCESGCAQTSLRPNDLRFGNCGKDFSRETFIFGQPNLTEVMFAPASLQATAEP